MAFIFFLAISLFIQGALGDIVCEKLPVELCSYSVASSGKRCILEKDYGKNGVVEYQCKTTEVVVDVLHEWVESDECITACGVDRKAVGISSDSLLHPKFTAKLCSHACYHECPNIVDLYFNLALGEGVYLPDLCEAAKHSNPHRSLRSSGAVPSTEIAPAGLTSDTEIASGPISDPVPDTEIAPGPTSDLVEAPTPSPQ